MKKAILLIFIISSLVYLQADMISGINIKNNMQIQKEKLYLNGAGMRSILFFDLYIGALYLKNKLDNARDIILLKKPMDIRMYITSSLVSSSKLKSGFKEAFAKSKESGFKTQKSKINRFLNSFNTKIQKKDIFDFLYLPKTGVTIYKNATLLQTIKGYNFKKALFGIWLGKHPAQKSLKEKMLGRQ